MEILKVIVDLIKNWPWSIIVLIIVVILKKPITEVIVLLGEKLCGAKIVKTKDKTEVSVYFKQAEVFSIQAGNETELVLPSGPAEAENKIQKDKLKTLLKENKFIEIEKECKKWREEDKKSVGPYVVMSRAYIKQSRYESAIEELKEAIRIKPDFAEVHVYLGVVYGMKGLYDQAIEEHKEAIRINPDSALAHYNLGWGYGEKGLYSEAIEEFKEAIRIKPDLAGTHLGLGMVYLFSNRRGDALDEYKILKELDKELANKLFNFIYE